MEKRSKKKGIILVLIILAILLVSIFIVAIIYLNSSGQRVKRQITLGDKYLSEMEYEEAVLAYSMAIDIDSKAIEAYIGLANSYIGLGDYEKALEIANQGIKKAGQNTELSEIVQRIEELISPVSDAANEEKTQLDETAEEVPTKKEYHLLEYGAGDGDILETQLVYYEGYYYFIANDSENARTLVRYSESDGSEEIVTGCASQLGLINGILYFTRSDNSGNPLTMCAYPLDGQVSIDDVSNGQINYSFNVVTYDDDYIVFDYAQDEIITAYAAAGRYDSPNAGQFILVGYPGPVLSMKMYDGEIYYEGTDNEFDPTPDKWYKKYSLREEEFVDITRDDVPEDFPFSHIVDDKDINIMERIEKYKAITGEDYDPVAVYHDNIIYNIVEYADGSFETTIKIYDYTGIPLTEISCEKYIGCANGQLLYFNYEEKPQFFELPS